MTRSEAVTRNQESCIVIMSAWSSNSSSVEGSRNSVRHVAGKTSDNLDGGQPDLPDNLDFDIGGEVFAQGMVEDGIDSIDFDNMTLVNFNCSVEEFENFTFEWSEGGLEYYGNVSCITEADNATIIDPYFYKVEQLTFLWILFSVIVLGNSTVLLALLSSKARKSRMNFFIMHLAAADLSVGVLSVLTDIVWKLTITWDAGLLACKTIRFLQVVVTYSSTYVLVALSIDRYDAITHPMNFTGSWRRARILVAAAWILSIVFSIPMLILYHLKDIPGYGTQCWIDFPETWHWKVYMTLVSLALFFLPAICIASCYAVIVSTIWNKSKLMKVPAYNPGTSTRVPLTEARRKRAALDDPDCRRASSRGLIPKAKVKTIKMTFVIVFVFILCWSPYIIFDLLQVYGLMPLGQNTSNAHQAVATFIQSLAPLNSAANPVIYFLFSSNVGKYLSNHWCTRHMQRVFCFCCPPDPLESSLNTSSTLRTTSTLLSSNNSQSHASHSRASISHARISKTVVINDIATRT